MKFSKKNISQFRLAVWILFPFLACRAQNKDYTLASHTVYFVRVLLSKLS